MSKKEQSELESLVQQQNQLLQSMNKLLQQQNELAAKFLARTEEQESFVEDLYRDEMRSGFLVTSHRKKLWNVQIGLINEFARICKKYNLRWFAVGGTLLGAARHKGFIPWDDDVDVAMLRPDYEKFKRVASAELKFPFFFDNWYEYRFESEEKFPEKLDPNLQWVTLSQDKNKPPSAHLTQWPSIRLRDSRTTFQENWHRYRKYVHQGIWIDIFPFDPVPPFKEDKHKVLFEAARQLLIATAYPNFFKDMLEKNIKLAFPREQMEKFSKLLYRERGARFDNFMIKNFFKSDRVGDLRAYVTSNTSKTNFQASDFDNIIYLPFEKIELPAPANYDSVLTDQYGDWRKLVFSPPHVMIYSADIPYTEYFKMATI